MRKHCLKSILIFLTLASGIVAKSEETPPPPDPIFLKPPTGQKKKTPPRYRVDISYSYPEICLSTATPYAYALIEASDSDGNIYGSTIVTPEESCAYLPLEPNTTITVTFDNGSSLQGEYR